MAWKSLISLLILVAPFAFATSSSLKKNAPDKIVQIKIQKSRSSDPSRPFTYTNNFRMGNVQIGQSKTWHLVTTNGETNSNTQVTNVTQPNSGAFVILNDQCTGSTLAPGQSCTMDLKFEPGSKARFTSSFQIQWNQVALDNSWTDTGVGTNNLEGSGFDIPPICEQQVLGSIVSVESRSLKEIIPLVGLDFTLNYQSQLAPEYINTRHQVVTDPSFNKGGWTLSLHHKYSPGQSRLFLGTGEIVEKVSLGLVNGNQMVVSLSGDEVYVFSEAGKHLETRTALTGVLRYTFEYDSNERLVKIVDAFSNETIISRDTNGFVTSIQSPFGQVTTFSTNSDGLIASVTNPKNETYSMTYKISSGVSTGLLETFTKPGGQVTTLTYDSNGKLIKDLGHGGNFWELILESNGSHTKTSQMGRETNYLNGYSNGFYSNITTEATGLVTTSFDYGNNARTQSNSIISTGTSVTDDERFGQVYKRISSSTLNMGSFSSVTSIAVSTDVTSDPFNFTFLNESRTTNQRTYTKNFNKTTNTYVLTSPEGAVSTTVLDSHERPTSSALGNDQAVTYSYDTKGRISSVVQGSKNLLNFSYNSSSGWLEFLTNGRSETTGYVYDLAGRVTSTILPDSRVIQYTYNSNGNMTSVTPPGKPVHNFQFNAMELTSKYLPPSVPGFVSKDTTYSYNLDKQLTQIAKPNGININYIYDSITGLLNSISTTFGSLFFSYHSGTDLLSSARSHHGFTSNFTYHGTEVKSEELVITASSFSLGKVSFGFDGDHRIVSRTVQGTTGQAADTVSITLNNDSKPTQYGSMALTYSYPSGRLATTTISGITDSRTYDSYGLLSSYTAALNGTPFYSYTLTRDSMSRITGVSETIQNVTTNYVYTFDTAGRLTLVTANGNVTSAFTYDSNGNRTSTTIDGSTYASTFDDQDRLVSYGALVYTHNRNGELTRMETSLGSQTNYVNDSFGNLFQANFPAGTRSEYYFDAQNRMVGRLYPDNTYKMQLYQDQLRVAGTVLVNGVVEKIYYYPTNSATPDYFKFQGSEYRIITNHLGSPRLVLRVSDGAVIQRMDYNVLGRVISDTSCLFQPFGFAGGLHDPDTNFVRFGARNYDPVTGRWTSKDPIFFDGGDTNLYGYVMNDPVNFIDPTGEAAVSGEVVCAALGLFEFGSIVMEVNRITNEYDQEVAKVREGKGPDLCIEDEMKIEELRQDMIKKILKAGKEHISPSVSGVLKVAACVAAWHPLLP